MCLIDFFNRKLSFSFPCFDFHLLHMLHRIFICVCVLIWAKTGERIYYINLFFENSFSYYISSLLKLNLCLLWCKSLWSWFHSEPKFRGKDIPNNYKRASLRRILICLFAFSDLKWFLITFTSKACAAYLLCMVQE